MATTTPTRTRGVSLQDLLKFAHQPTIDRLAREGLSQEDAEFLFEDVLRFLYLLSGTKKLIAAPPAIKEANDIFMSEAQVYEDFCSTYFGQYLEYPPVTDVRVKNCRDLADKVFELETLSENWD